MKTELGITKGEWEVEKFENEFESTIYSNGVRIAEAKSFGSGFNDATSNQRIANAKLIAEAGTVANETGKTPRQLAEENKVLLDALISISEYWNRDRNDGAMHDALWHIINVSESAIKQSTE